MLFEPGDDLQDMWPTTELHELNGILENRAVDIGSPAERRQALSSIGTFCSIASVPLEGEHWAAVDGSWVSFGNPYPYVVDLYRAIAKSIPGATAVKKRLFTPMRPSDQLLYAEYGGRGEEGLNAFRHKLMIEMEVEAGRDLVETVKPTLLMMDGGLMPVESKAEGAWLKLCDAADKTGTTVVGVIEDIATYELAKLIRLNATAPDREVLHGVLSHREAFIPDPVYAVKSDRFATAFVRWANDPRPVGVDVRAKDSEKLRHVLNALGCIVQADGRGIPQWLDMVDRDVRISHDSAEDWLKEGLGANFEAFVQPHRNRRMY